jgi:hypothetical protein
VSEGMETGCEQRGGCEKQGGSQQRRPPGMVCSEPRKKTLGRVGVVTSCYPQASPCPAWFLARAESDPWAGVAGERTGYVLLESWN